MCAVVVQDRSDATLVADPTTTASGPPKPRRSTAENRRFRRDVEGLRAVAILLVVLYHCHAVVPGGYVGVDVFFVISGFLITTQLVRELIGTGRISFAGFYARRARRILPAATLTTIVTLVVSGLLLSPLAARRAFGDERAATVFAANIHFAARDANYFNSDLPPSPVQHYWSLSVEEQFYIMWPLLLVASSLVWLGLRRRSTKVFPAPANSQLGTGLRNQPVPKLKVVVLILGAVALASLACSVVETPQAPTAYYSILTRAWELAAGALVALLPALTGRLDARLAAFLTWIGIGCIAVAAASFDASTAYPGYAALLPVAGAVLIMAAGATASRRRGAEALLGTHPFQRVGGWSYSWYLWHWPVLILAPALLGHSLSTREALTMAALSLVLAVLSFVFVERPIRRIQTIVRRPWLGLSAAAATIGATLGLVTLAGPVLAAIDHGRSVPRPSPAHLAADLRSGVKTRMVPGNLNPQLGAASQNLPLIAQNGCLLVDAATKSQGCVYGDKASHTVVVLFGDSHAAAWFPAVNTVSKQQHWRLVVITKSGCPAAAVNVVRKDRLFTECPIWRRNAESQIAALDPALVVVASARYLGGAQPLAGIPTGYGSTWQNGTQATFSFLHRSAQRVVFISDVPRFPGNVPDCVSAHTSNVRTCTVARPAAVVWPQAKAQELALAKSNQLNTIDPFSWFCTQTRCAVVVGNILLYRDDQHMTAQWARFLATPLAHALTPVMQESPSTGSTG